MIAALDGRDLLWIAASVIYVVSAVGLSVAVWLILTARANDQERERRRFEFSSPDYDDMGWLTAADLVGPGEGWPSIDRPWIGHGFTVRTRPYDWKLDGDGHESNDFAVFRETWDGIVCVERAVSPDV